VNWIESFATQLSGGGVTGLAAFGVAFLGGLVAGFGPCVLPMLPAVFGYVTGHVAEADVPRGTAWRRGLALSATFVLGMALLFAGIGAAAGAIGHAIIVGAWAYYAVAAICVILGLQMLGLINIRFDALNRFLPTTRPRGRGFVGAFVFGILFGIVASPCSTPILAAIATIAAARGSAVGGAVMLFFYGLGKGVPLLLLGVASGSLALMRSVSRCTGVLTKIGGVAMLGAAAYLIWLA
jgi:cytochrome c-type biogenesis protein